MILSEINLLKSHLSKIEDDAKQLDNKNLRDYAASVLRSIRDSLNDLGISIEKHISDKKDFEELKQDVLLKLKDDLFSALSSSEKEKIAEKILLSKDKVVLTESELIAYYKSRLQKLSTEDLIITVYSKSDIIKIGESTRPTDSSNTILYNAGLSVLESVAGTPVGRNQAIAYGLSNIKRDSAMRRKIILNYYGI